MLIIYRSEFWELITNYNISKDEFITLKKENPNLRVEIRNGNRTKLVSLSRLSLSEKWRK